MLFYCSRLTILKIANEIEFLFWLPFCKTDKRKKGKEIYLYVDRVKIFSNELRALGLPTQPFDRPGQYMTVT